PTDLQIHLNPPDEHSRRTFTIHARPTTRDTDWTCHATGVLAPATSTTTLDAATPGGVWPPPTATPLPIKGLYQQLTEHGYGYGPAFHGLHAAWRDGNDLYAEVRLPDDLDEEGFGIHPALLDAALHTVTLDLLADHGQPVAPFSW